jgi:16S rRNA (cytosine967-C5)-methyltransferase
VACQFGNPSGGSRRAALPCYVTAVARPTGLSQRLRPDRVRSAALEALAAIRQEGQLADRALSRILRRERDLWSAERRAVAESVYGLLRNERSIDLALERSLAASRAPRLVDLPPSVADGARLAAWEARQGVPPALVGLPERVAAAIPRIAETWQQILGEAREPLEQLALTSSLPRWVLERFVDRLGEVETARLVEALNERAPLTVRANILKTDREKLAQEFLAEGANTLPGRYSPWALQLTESINALGLKAFRDGHFEIQDEGSQLLALLCDARPRQIVVDSCAGAGGKSLALAATMRNRGELWALDTSEKRLDQLRPRSRRAGVDNLRVQPVPEVGPWPAPIERLAGRADVVLVDAPCSGIGALRRNPDARRRMQEADIAIHAERQFGILARASELVASGGRLIYGTCSLFTEENEAVVERFLAAHPEFEPRTPSAALGAARWSLLEEATADGPPGLRSPLGLRLWPQRHGTDGFFASLLLRVQPRP